MKCIFIVLILERISNEILYIEIFFFINFHANIKYIALIKIVVINNTREPFRLERCHVPYLGRRASSACVAK